MTRSLVPLLACLALGCGDSTTAATSDAPRDGDPTCRSWRRESVDLVDVASLESVAPNPERATRVLATLRQCADDIPAKPLVGFTLENEYVVLDMGVWRDRPACTNPIDVVRPVVLHFPYAANWKFTLADGTVRTIDVVVAPGGACNTAAVSCARDCDCSEGVCLSGSGLAGAFTRCARPCELDRDCGGQGTCRIGVADDLDHVCQLGMDECASATDCPVGFECDAGACTPTFVLNGASRHECTCDSECDAGLRCVIRAGVASGRCEAVCETAANGWCQGPHVCEAGSVDSDPSVCGWIGD